MSKHGSPFTGPVLSGAISGSVTTVAFAAMHHVLISDIWFSLVPMLVVGATCGVSLAWSYRLLFGTPGLATWMLYNATYMILLVILGIASLLLFEPVTTSAAVIAASEPPGDLIASALPLTLGFLLGAVVLISGSWARSPREIVSVALTCTILVILFGLNISVIGLVELSGPATTMTAMFFGLIMMIMAGNATAFALLERRGLFRYPGGGDGVRRDGNARGDPRKHLLHGKAS